MGKKNNVVVKALLITCGTVSLGAGIAGVFLPILPTTPFIIVSAACFMRSSGNLYNKLKTSDLYKKTAGSMIEKKGMTLKAKLLILIPVWIMLVAMIFAVDSLALKILAITLGTVKTVVFAMMKTIKE